MAARSIWEHLYPTSPHPNPAAKILFSSNRDMVEMKFLIYQQIVQNWLDNFIKLADLLPFACVWMTYLKVIFQEQVKVDVWNVAKLLF